jgi:flagellar FliL protein
MGTRYLKVSFTAFSSNPDLQKIITDNKQQLLDVAINTLSSRTLAELEVAGAKNMVRNDLIGNFNQALNSDVISQIYFSEFVVQ